MRAGAALVITARPKTPKPGELVRITLEFGPPTKGEMTPDPKQRFRLEEGIAILYRLDRSKPPQPETYKLHAAGDPGTYGFSKQIADDGEYRVYFSVAYQGGRTLRAGFDLVTFGAIPRDHHDEGNGTRPDEGKGHEVHAQPPDLKSSSGGLSMAAQHQTMREIGMNWITLGRSLDRSWAPEDRQKAGEDIEVIEQWARNLPRFKLHRYPEQKKGFLALHGELEGRLRELGRLAATATPSEFRGAYRRLDATSCTKCHLKFRWGVIKDLSRFPDLSGQPE